MRLSRIPYRPRVLVCQIQRVPRELEAAGIIALDEEGVVATCAGGQCNLRSAPVPDRVFLHALPPGLSVRKLLTDDLPDQVGRNVRHRHLGCCCGSRRDSSKVSWKTKSSRCAFPPQNSAARKVCARLAIPFRPSPRNLPAAGRDD